MICVFVVGTKATSANKETLSWYSLQEIVYSFLLAESVGLPPCYQPAGFSFIIPGTLSYQRDVTLTSEVMDKSIEI